MSASLRDRVWMSVSGTPGTGAVTLGSALSAYQSAASAGVQDGETNTWVFVDGSAWEISSCSYTSAGTSLARTLISSSTGSLISLTSSATAMLTESARDCANAAIISFGDGSDGDVTLSGALTLSRDMFYRNVTVIAGAAVNTNGWRVFASGLLDMTAAPGGAFYNNGGAGSAATVLTSGGNAGSTPGQNSIGGNAGPNNSSAAAGGKAGSVIAGTAGGVGSAAGTFSGGTTGSSGASGAGTNAGAAAVSHAALTYHPGVGGPWMSAVNNTYSSIANVWSAGAGGTGAASGGGDGTSRGGSSGGGGGGGGAVMLFARYFKRTGAAAGAIRAMGGAAGAGFAPTAGNCGGAGGSTGGGGGWVTLGIGSFLDSTPATGLVDVSGGNGADGTNGVGTGVGGDGGDSGAGGTVTVYDFTSGSVTTTLGSAVVTGSAHSGITGGAKGTAATSRVTV